MEFISAYGLFLAKTVTFLVAFIVVFALVMSASSKGGNRKRDEQVAIEKINDTYDEYVELANHAILSDDDLKQKKKDKKEKEKADKKAEKLAKKSNKGKPTADTADNESAVKKRVFVLDFDGDIKASDTDQLRELITVVLSVATPKDEVVVRLESSGGMVHSYGLASSQLSRIVSKDIPLTICVDKVAASGGYMMACVANKIIAAPFAIIGSIGVVAQLPNFHKLLKKNDVDYEMLTAGEYKRTLTMFGENTDKGRQKFVEELEDTHELFKDFIRENRAALDVEKVATGEIWFGTRALQNQLIDEIQTSDEYLFNQKDTADLYEVSISVKKTFAEKVGLNVEASFERVISRWLQAATNRFFM